MTSLETGPAAVRPLQALVPLVTRVIVAQVFILAGMHKFDDYAAATAGFEKLGIPAPDVVTGVVAGIEVAGGVAILLGLFTRLAAFLLCGVMVVALATAHVEDLRTALVLRPEQGKSLTALAPVLMLGFLGWLLAFGPGAISLDRLRIGRRRRDDLQPHATRTPHRTIEPYRSRAEREHALPSRSDFREGASDVDARGGPRP